MSEALPLFPPTRKAAQAALEAFVPRAGADYARWRNVDYGPGRHDRVSTLSPWIKVRMLDEVAVVRAVLAAHSDAEADKFLAEVFWRTYWKGWMELRPAVWQEYQRDLNRLRDDIQTQSGLRQRWEAACLGRTGVEPFDLWAKELAESGYLHNHARMWFASIWIFTLELPWQLGADFFLRHLLDGDAAVNTLSWRWVAGIQTPGKTYLATAENIAQNTDGRFPDVKGLAERAVPREAGLRPPAGELPPCPSRPASGRYGMLLHGDDVDATRLLQQAPEPVAVAYLDATPGHSPWAMAAHVAAFRRQAAEDMVGGPVDVLESADDVTRWACSHDLAQIVAPYAPVGPMQDTLARYSTEDPPAPLNLFRRPLDSAAWPLATKGFFPFRKNIPDLIGKFVRRAAEA